MLNKQINASVYVVSHKRPENVAKLSQLVGNVTWVVGKGEKQTYQYAGAEKVIEGGGLCESRNVALKEAWARGYPCIQLSDDLKKLSFAKNHGQEKSAAPISFVDAAKNMIDRLRKTPYKMAGIAPTANLFYFNKPSSENLFIIGDFIIVEPCDLLFDEKMKLKEDYDYTLQHFGKFGGALRCNDVLAEFLHRTNKGGAVAVRTSELEQQMIAYLKAKWGDSIRDNPRRPDEILLRAKKVVCAEL